MLKVLIYDTSLQNLKKFLSISSLYDSKNFLSKRFQDINVRNFFFFNFQSCADIFEYISSYNWAICLSMHSNYRQLNPPQLSFLKFSDRPSSSDASNFNKLEKLANIFDFYSSQDDMLNFDFDFCQKIQLFRFIEMNELCLNFQSLIKLNGIKGFLALN